MKKIVSLCKEYCGAVAISWYRSEYTQKAIDMLVSAGVTYQYSLRPWTEFY